MDSAPPEHALLVDALGLGATAGVSLLSREPLGDGSVAGFRVSPPGGEALTYFVDTSRRVVGAETGILSGTPDAPDVRVWLHPADPHLPALAPVAFSDAAGALLARLGIEAVGVPELVVYRPGRRAVLRVATSLGSAWVKAVPPDRVAGIVDAHRSLGAAGIPVPVVRGYSDRGLIVWDPATGTPAADSAWTPEGLVEEVDALRRGFAAVRLERPARTGLERRRDWYAERLPAVLPPDQAEVAEAVVARARRGWRDPVEATVHGDLHFGQLFLAADLRISGVIDVDTAGVGAPGDDTSAFVAHAIASALLTPAPRDQRLWELARLALTRWGAPGVPARTATHLLGHALGAAEQGDGERARRLLSAAASVSVGDTEALGSASPD